MILSLLVTPILGVIGIILSGENTSLQKKVTLTSSLLTFVLSLVLWAGFDSNYNGFQFVSSFPTVTTQEVDCLILLWCGGQHVEEPFITLGQFATAFYFGWFLIILPTVGIIENTLMDLAADENKTVSTK